MKKLFLLLFLITLFSCDNPAAVQVITITEDPPIIEEPPEEEQNEIILALYDGLDLKFFDGEFFNAPYTGQINYAGNKIMSVDDILYKFDSYGVEVESFRLSGIPEYLLYDGVDVGAIYVPIKSAVKVPTGQIIVTELNGSLTNTTDSKVPFKLFPDLFIYDLSGRTVYMNDSLISFVENYFYTARWNKCGDKFYSNYGMIFDDTGFTENATALKDFKSTSHPYAISYLPNGERPSLHPAGQNYEHSEYVSYFIESTSGHLIRYVPSIDQYDILPKIYQGPNNMSTGNIEAANLNPQWINGLLYFHHGGSIKTYDPVIGSVNIFAVDQELFAWN